MLNLSSETYRLIMGIDRNCFQDQIIEMLAPKFRTFQNFSCILTCFCNLWDERMQTKNWLIKKKCINRDAQLFFLIKQNICTIFMLNSTILLIRVSSWHCNCGLFVWVCGCQGVYICSRCYSRCFVKDGVCKSTGNRREESYHPSSLCMVCARVCL